MINFHVNAIGKLKNKSINNVVLDYQSRIFNNIEIHEFELKRTKNSIIQVVKEQEMRLLTANISKNSYVISMDETGDLMTSKEFANLISKKTIEGFSSFIFLIGGANGLHQNAIKQSNKKLSLGKITLPHMLARLILVEQIYRAERIIMNHPYDK